MIATNELLAKSDGTSLTTHLEQVAAVAEKLAAHHQLDKAVVRAGAILHDIGKVHPEFQKRLSSPRTADYHGIALRHEIASLLFLPLFPKIDWDNLIEMVVAHHRSTALPNNEGNGILDLVEIEGFNKTFNRHAQDWSEWSPKAIKVLNSFGFEGSNITLDEAKEAFEYVVDYCENVPAGWSKMKGLLNSADYMASALNSKVYIHLDRLNKVPDLSLYGADNRKSPLYPLSLLDTNSRKPHSLVIAPTGAGKTDYLFRRCQGRAFYTLPFQASINAMYHRVKNFLPKDTDIRLLHATSSLQIENADKYEETVMQSLAGAGIKILTPHQLAALICGTKGFEAIALDISNCDVILDEIHCYSEVSQAMVLEIVKVLLMLNCRIHIGSATMPSILTDMVLKILGGESNVLITRLSDEELDTFDRHRIFKHTLVEDTLTIIDQAVEQNQKILIVCNKVTTAQARFEEFKKRYQDIDILLLHSRFKRGDRAAKEKDLIDNYNNRTENAKACIVVSTQVVEVSLDISFDVMVTDAAPIDSLIQRFGRINRQRTNETVKQKIIKDIHIIAPPEKATDVLPYKKEFVDASFAQFENCELLKEAEIQAKIDNVYPELDIKSIHTKIVWDGDSFLLSRLRHLPKAVLIETLNIESATVILKSDQEIYEKGPKDIRIPLEIPVPRSVRFRKFTNYGISEYAARPIIVDDELYTQETGLVFKEIDNFI
jgi:CRISPR-associated endonuclease/helicase Cas3